MTSDWERLKTYAEGVTWAEVQANLISSMFESVFQFRADHGWGPAEEGKGRPPPDGVPWCIGMSRCGNKERAPRTLDQDWGTSGICTKTTCVLETDYPIGVCAKGMDCNICLEAVNGY